MEMTKSSHGRIDAGGLRGRLDSGDRLQLVDVRSRGEYDAGHLPGSINVPLDQIELRMDDLSERCEVVLVCQTGGRAAMSRDLIGAGKPRVLVLEGGLDAWSAADCITVQSQSARWPLERQVRLVAGLLILLGTILALTVASGWIFVALGVGAGLTFAGLTGICGMSSLFALLPWNRPRKPQVQCGDGSS
ncbi:MAG: rhodanese-like domain-containing protein [Armatimonadetes bacterium]|nr:rhodanese-like domain-containing protein [Armatimonadota bacterium]